jgi:hypothetical protein
MSDAVQIIMNNPDPLKDGTPVSEDNPIPCVAV